MTILVTVESKTIAQKDWQFEASAECEIEDMAFTARTLWDEIPGADKKRRVVFEAPDGAELRMERRP